MAELLIMDKSEFADAMEDLKCQIEELGRRDEFYTHKELAQKLGRHPRTILLHIRNKVLKARKLGDDYIIFESWLKESRLSNEDKKKVL